MDKDKILNGTLRKELQGIAKALTEFGTRAMSPEQIAQMKIAVVRFSDLTKEEKESITGKDGYTPKRGKDFMTPEDRQYFIEKIFSLIELPVKGIHYYTKEEQQKIIDELTKYIDKLQKEKDYFTKKEKKEFLAGIKAAIHIPKRGVDYLTEKELKMVQGAILKMTVSDLLGSPEKMARALEKLKGTERLSYKALKDTPKNRSGDNFFGGGQITVSVTPPPGPFLHQLWLDIS